MINAFPYHIVDLTHTLDKNTPAWNGGCGFGHEIKSDYHECDAEVQFRVQQVKMHAGIGTHIDAPAHCIKGAITVESIALEQLIVPAVCIDVSVHMAADYLMSTHDILAFEKQYGKIASGSFVAVYTGWSQHWAQPQYHNQYRFPSISAAAAELLLERNIVGLGIDTLSPDVPSSGFPVHKLLLEANKYIVENITNAEKLPNTGVYILILPIKASGLTEAPVRMIGLTPIKDNERA